MKFIQLRFHYQRGRRRVFAELINHKKNQGLHSELSTQLYNFSCMIKSVIVLKYNAENLT